MNKAFLIIKINLNLKKINKFNLIILLKNKIANSSNKIKTYRKLIQKKKVPFTN